jgi:hypothetical protein
MRIKKFYDCDDEDDDCDDDDDNTMKRIDFHCKQNCFASY